MNVSSMFYVNFSKQICYLSWRYHAGTKTRVYMPLVLHGMCQLVLFLVIFCVVGRVAIGIMPNVRADDKAVPFSLTAEERQWLAAHPSIRIGINNNWPPMDFVDQDGQPDGIGVSFIKALNQRLNGALKIVPGPWKEIYNDVKNARLDALMDITPREDRAQYFDFTTPYIHIPHVVFARRDDPSAGELRGLTGRTVAVEKGFFIMGVLHEKYPGIFLKEYKTTTAALFSVSKGEADVYIGNRAVATFLIEKALIANIKEYSVFAETASINAIGVRKDQPILRNILQKALDHIDVGERRKILQHWTGTWNVVLAVQIILAITVIVAFFGAWNWSLHRQIRERKKAEATLKIIGQRLDLALKGGNLGLWDVNMQTGTTIVNERWAEILGYQLQEITPLDRDRWLTLLHPDDKAWVVKMGQHYIDGQLPNYDLEYRVINKQGDQRWVASSGARVELEDGVPARLVGIMTDITSRKIAEQEVAQAKERAIEATRLKDKFVALVAHDLRSPLSSMISLMEFVVEDNDNPLHEEHKEFMQGAVKTGRNLIDMIAVVLDIGRLQTGQISLDKYFLNGHFLVDDMLQRLANLSVTKRLTMINEVPNDARFYADHALFGEVIQNLLSNAIKFSKVGGTIRVFVPDGAPSSIAIQDQGIGIPEDIIPKLFNVAEKISTPGTEGEPGTGFGLPFSNDIMSAHNGKLSVVSTSAKGSTFTAWLPNVRPCVLVVDDEPDGRLLISQILQPFNLDIIEIEDGNEALASIAKQRPNLIIADLKTPVVDGLQLLVTLNAQATTKTIPVIIITADKDADTLERAFQLGAADVVNKPIDAHNFVPRVRHILCG